MKWPSQRQSLQQIEFCWRIKRKHLVISSEKLVDCDVVGTRHSLISHGILSGW